MRKIKKLFLKRKKEKLFLEPDIFYNYQNSDDFDHNFGLRLNLGYELNNFEIFGIAGYQKFLFDNNSDIYKKDHAPLFGIGVGYKFDPNIAIRLSASYSNLKRKVDNSDDRITTSELGVIFLF